MLDISVFILTVSLISTAIPLSFLSWPAYSWHLELPVPEPVEPYYIYWLPYRGISFSTIDIVSIPRWEYHDGVWSARDDLSALEESIIAFQFFLLVNILGALLGYLIGKKHRFSGDGWIILWGFAGIVCLGVSLILVRPPKRAGMVLLGSGIISLETIIFSWLIEYYARARVASLMIQGGIILLLVGQLINQIPTITGGKMLILFGAIIYFVKLTVASMRTREREKEAENK